MRLLRTRGSCGRASVPLSVPGKDGLPQPVPSEGSAWSGQAAHQGIRRKRLWAVGQRVALTLTLTLTLPTAPSRPARISVWVYFVTICVTLH